MQLLVCTVHQERAHTHTEQHTSNNMCCMYRLTDECHFVATVRHCIVVMVAVMHCLCFVLVDNHVERCALTDKFI